MPVVLQRVENVRFIHGGVWPWDNNHHNHYYHSDYKSWQQSALPEFTIGFAVGQQTTPPVYTGLYKYTKRLVIRSTVYYSHTLSYL